jgi:hypothetical protein
MTPRKPFSIEQSEELIAQLKTESASEFEQLRKTLLLLGQVPELSQGMVPPILPSQINQTVVDFVKKASKSHRTILASFITAGILASATLTAAAVTGRGPAPIVSAAHQTAKFVKDVVGTVTHVVTGGNSSNAPTSNNRNDQLPVPSATATPSGDNKPGDSSADHNSSGDNSTEKNSSLDNFSEGSGVPVILQPGNSTEDKSNGGETKSGKNSSHPSSGENGNDTEKSTGDKHSETPKPEITQAPAGEVVPQQDVPTPAPGISQPAGDSDTEGSD